MAVEEAYLGQQLHGLIAAPASTDSNQQQKLAGRTLMIRSALLLCAALLAALTFACVAPPGSAPVLRTPQPFWLAAGDQLRTYDALTACSDGTDPAPFVNKAYTLSDGYFPSTAGPGTYSPPFPIGVQVATTNSLSQEANDLRAAYCMASRTFKKQLDQITNVFITCDLNNCTPSQNSSFYTTWGYRENAINQSALQQTFISLSINIWSNSGKLQPYSSFEMSIYSNLLPNQDPLIGINASDSQGSDHTEWTILAALAHELGHIYWWKLDAANYATRAVPPSFGNILGGGKRGRFNFTSLVNNRPPAALALGEVSHRIVINKKMR